MMPLLLLILLSTRNLLGAARSQESPVAGERRALDLTTVYVLPRSEPINATVEHQCRDALASCYNGTEFKPLHDDGPIRPDPYRFSTMIRFKRSYGELPLPIELNDEFLEQLSLLHNNTDQLRVLLTLMRTSRASDWMSFLGGYTQCDAPKSVVFTCVESVCYEHDLMRLNYTTDLFTENVLGLDVSPPVLSVLVLLRNNHTKAESVVRVPTSSMSLLDGTYNLLRTILGHMSLDTDLIGVLRSYRDRFPAVFSVSDQIKITRQHYRPQYQRKRP
ncbi:M115 protein [Murid betaherpesvirus 1]|uniref:Envelope glycoprotein L n=1 Tax=Murid herpesvirus 1 TaxID=10366 RepID=H2A2V2_MUHV1|nr:M115 protein [Murid betaherpesvirus 1]